MILEEKTYVDKAEAVMNSLAKSSKYGIPNITTSKLRNILAMTMDIYNQVLVARDEQLSDEIQSRIQYLKIRIIYEYGRDDKNPHAVQEFINRSELLKCIKEINGSRKNFILFAHYLEALVAYRKFLGRDKDL